MIALKGVVFVSFSRLSAMMIGAIMTGVNS